MANIRGVASGWTGWKMSNGPDGPGSPNQSDTIGLWALAVPCPWAPRVLLRLWAIYQINLDSSNEKEA